MVVDVIVCNKARRVIHLYLPHPRPLDPSNSFFRFIQEVQHFNSVIDANAAVEHRLYEFPPELSEL